MSQVGAGEIGLAEVVKRAIKQRIHQPVNTFYPERVVPRFRQSAGKLTGAVDGAVEGARESAVDGALSVKCAVEGNGENQGAREVDGVAEVEVMVASEDEGPR
jgi:hypothetical protein